MENNDLKNLENQRDEKIQIYENDDAYLLGEEISGSGDGIFKDNNIKNNQNELLNKLNTNSSPEEEQEEQDQNNENKIDNNLNVNNSLVDKKYMINDINSDLEVEENENNNNIKNESNNNLNNGNYINNNVENESNDSELPLVTLNFLSICQCCKNSFNSVDNVPFLFKCGHFFCKQCIIQQFTDEEGIKCPTDGLVANSISELKILNNFITDKTVTQRTSTNCLIPSGQYQIQNNFTNSNNNINNYSNIQYKTCEIHKGQKLTHFIEETKELICVYCAFDRFKQNQGIEIKEIIDKCHEMEQEMDSIIEENQYNVGIIQASLKEIKKNKENEEKKICEIFDKLIEVVKLKRDGHLNKVDNLFTNNAEKLSQKLELFSYKIEKSEEIKEKINIFLNNEDNNKFIQLLEYYNKIKNEIKLVQNLKLNLYKYKFCYDDEITVSKIISKFGEIKLIPKAFTFMGNSIRDEKDLVPEENIKEKIKVKLNNFSVNNTNNLNYETDNNFKNYNFLENIKSLKSNNSTTNFYKRPINSCNNTINSNKVNKIINNNANRNLRLKTCNNNRVIDSNFINNTFSNTHKKNMKNINYSPKINGGIRINSPHSMHHKYTNCRNTNDNYINKYKINLNKINGNNIKNNNIRKNQFNSNYNDDFIKYDDFPFC